MLFKTQLKSFGFFYDTVSVVEITSLQKVTVVEFLLKADCNESLLLSYEILSPV